MPVRPARWRFCSACGLLGDRPQHGEGVDPIPVLSPTGQGLEQIGALMEEWCKITVPSCPDAVATRCLERGACLAFGAYELHENRRIGGVGLIKFSPEDKPLLAWKALDFGVLDLHWFNENSLVVASADGGIRALQVQDGASGWTVQQHLDGPAIALSVCLGAGASEGKIVTSFADGAIALATLDSPSWLWERTQAHAHEAWFACFGAQEYLIMSGGDDGYLRLWDSRLRPQEDPCVSSYQAHEALGVTRACFLDEHVFVSGGFDEKLRFWDTRMLGRSWQTLQMPGGPWRIEVRGTSLLVACMQGHAAIVDLLGPLPRLQVHLGQHMDHSLVYAASWLPGLGHNLKCVTASFYERILYVWRSAPADSVDRKSL